MTFADIGHLVKAKFYGWVPPQLCGFVCTFHPVVPGSNPKHTIQVCIFHYSQLYHIFYYTEKKDENIQKKFYGTGPWQHEGGQRRESVHAMPGRAGVGWRGGVAVIGWFDLTHLLQFLEMRMTKECSLLELLSSVTRRKSPNVYKSCPKMISLEQ